MTDQSKVLLIVEDDEGLQRQLKWAYDGYEVICAGDRAQAIEALRAHEPAVVTLDLGLPPDPDGTDEGFATLEEILPHLRPGGVYICEDVHQEFNRFMDYMGGFVNKLNAVNLRQTDPVTSVATPFQSAVHSVHFYPYVVVIERNETPPGEFMAPRHGTEWQPFLSTDGVRRPATA